MQSRQSLVAPRPCALRPVLGDQLSPGLATLRQADRDRDIVLLAEVQAEAVYVRHHPQKIALVFAAMRKFAAELEQRGFRVRYVQLDDPANTGSLQTEIERAFAELQPGRVVMTEPAEWRLKAAIPGWSARLGLAIEVLEDDRFLVSHADFRRWADGRKTLRMEYFYREQRRRHGILLDADGGPVGGSWNFDAANRRRYDAAAPLPAVMGFPPDAETVAVMELVQARFGHHFGDLAGFDWAVTREQAKAGFEHFLRVGLPAFGDYQDAMLRDSEVLFHARISAALNIGLLDPLEVCRRVEAEYRQGRVPLNAAEGFIRQILGWREFIRGIYWLHMPDYATRNVLDAQRHLPEFFWGGATDLHCIARVIDQTRRSAYAHHIQRLMVTGNFALLAGVHPEEVCDWYLAVYADAFEWVELPNTLGMALHADGGVVGSKPYCASGAYVERMSDYCRDCRYDTRQRSGSEACPFNYLYWDFLMRHEQRLRANPRMAMSYRNLDRITGSERVAIQSSAQAFLDRVAPVRSA